MLRIARKIKNSAEQWLHATFRVCGKYISENVPSDARVFSDRDAHIYCGYYDVTPFNKDNSKLLALRVVGKNISPHDSNIKAEIGYYNLDYAQFIKIAETTAWNWQQGCRLQWLSQTTDTIIYNDFRNNSFVSIARSLKENTNERIYERPIYALRKDGLLALSLDFTRLHRYRRGYGYHNMPAPENSAPDNDGLWQMDMKSGASKLLVSLLQIAAFMPQENMFGAYHYLNHLQWAPDGETIVFFHLWYSNGKKKNSRLMILRDGILSKLQAPIRPSHTGWSQDGSLLLTGLKSGSKNTYHLFQDMLEEGLEIPITVDGHPSFINEQAFISDTYPNAMGHQSLYVSDLRGNRKDIASFYLPINYTGEMRCDLHPRLSPDQRICAVDIIKDSKRAIAIIPVKP